MPVIQFTSTSDAPSVDLSESSLRVLRSIIHTISLLEKSTNEDLSEAPPFLEDWVNEAFELIQQFSKRIGHKSEQYGHHHFAPILHVATHHAEEAENNLQSLIAFKNKIKEAMSQAHN